MRELTIKKTARALSTSTEMTKQSLKRSSKNEICVRVRVRVSLLI